MRVLLLIFIFLSVTVINCNVNEPHELEDEIPDFEINYPRVVDSLRLRDLYDSTIWHVYTWNCDRKFLPKSDSSKNLYYGFLPLEFKDLAIKGDTVEFHCYFTYNNEMILPGMTRDFSEISSGVGYSIKERKRIYMWSPSGYISKLAGPNNRFENPLQPDVVKFINDNKLNLNDMFRIFATLRGAVYKD